MTFTARKNSSSIPITPLTKADIERQRKSQTSKNNKWFEKVGFIGERVMKKSCSYSLPVQEKYEF